MLLSSQFLRFFFCWTLHESLSFHSWCILLPWPKKNCLIIFLLCALCVFSPASIRLMKALTPKRLFLSLCISFYLSSPPLHFFLTLTFGLYTLFENACELQRVVLHLEEFSGIVDYVFKFFLLDFANKALFLVLAKKKKKKKNSHYDYALFLSRNITRLARWHGWTRLRASLHRRAWFFDIRDTNSVLILCIIVGVVFFFLARVIDHTKKKKCSDQLNWFVDIISPFLIWDWFLWLLGDQITHNCDKLENETGCKHTFWKSPCFEQDLKNTLGVAIRDEMEMNWVVCVE